MTRVDTRLAEIRSEQQKATQELEQTRLRLQYLEALVLRLDGAASVLLELQEEVVVGTNGAVETPA